MENQKTKANRYYVIEKQPADLITEIDLNRISNESIKKCESICDVINHPNSEVQRLTPEYIDEEPLFDLFNKGELISQDITESEVLKFFKENQKVEAR